MDNNQARRARFKNPRLALQQLVPIQRTPLQERFTYHLRKVIAEREGNQT